MPLDNYKKLLIVDSPPSQFLEMLLSSNKVKQREINRHICFQFCEENAATHLSYAHTIPQVYCLQMFYLVSTEINNRNKVRFTLPLRIHWAVSGIDIGFVMGMQTIW